LLLDLAGDTPIVRPQELGVDLGCTLLAKHESQTQGG